MSENGIKVAVQLSKGIMVQAKGHPATIVSYAAAAAITFVSVAVALSAYQGGSYLVHRVRKKPSPADV